VDQTPNISPPELPHDLEAGFRCVKYVTLSAANVSAARNAGAVMAAAPLLLFVDDDIELCRDYMDVLLQAIGQNATDVVGGRYVGDFSDEDSCADELQYCEWLPGGNFAVRRRDFLSVGGFDENIYRFNEDAEISHRLRQSGLRLARHNRLRAIHHHRPIGGAWQHRAVLTNARDVMRNELYFLHAVGGGLATLLRGAGRNIKQEARGQGRISGGAGLSRVAACGLNVPGAIAYAFRAPKLLEPERVAHRE
jgi:glycosyltransferase involved in cell wall biosynthesis